MCDVDGQKLLKREDDSEEVIKKRFKIYETETRPLINYYKSLNVYKRIEAQGNQEEVSRILSEIVDDYLNSKCRSN